MSAAPSIPATRTRQSFLAGSSPRSFSWVDPVISTGTPRCLVALDATGQVHRVPLRPIHELGSAAGVADEERARC